MGRGWWGKGVAAMRELSTCSLPGDALQPPGFLLPPGSPEVASPLSAGVRGSGSGDTGCGV